MVQRKLLDKLYFERLDNKQENPYDNAPMEGCFNT